MLRDNEVTQRWLEACDILDEIERKKTLNYAISLRRKRDAEGRQMDDGRTPGMEVGGRRAGGEVEGGES